MENLKYSKETSIFNPLAIKNGIATASGIATKYLMSFSQDNGLWITPSTKKPNSDGTPITTGTNKTTGTKIDGSGIAIYREGIEIAKYGSSISLASNEATVTIGSTSKYHSVLSNTGMVFKNGANTTNSTLMSISGNTITLYSPNTTTAAAILNSNGLVIAAGSISLGSNFSVNTSGVLSATGATISGTLTAGADSSIGPWTVTATSIYKGSATHGTSGSGNMYFGNSGLSISNKFKVDNTGVLNATGAIVSGAITASSLIISSGATVSGDGASQILNSELEGALDAAKKTATNYITQIDNNGIWVTPTGKKPTNTSTGAGATGAKINADGMDIYKNGVSVAKYGDTARVGKIADGASRIEIAGEGIDLIRESGLSEINLAHFGYDSGAAEEGTDTAPYYTLGKRYTESYGNYSVAEGLETDASGFTSHAEGHYTAASNSYSHAEGDRAEASGLTSHAEGSQTVASNSYSHAEGCDTVASGVCSHAEGSGTEASEDYSHAEGYYTEASGVGSHAEGRYTEASGSNSHAEGRYTIAHDGSHVEGKYNVEDINEEYAHIIGNGYSGRRSNALAVSWHGDLYIQGDIYTQSDSDSTGGTKLSNFDFKVVEKTSTQTFTKTSSSEKTFSVNNESGYSPIGIVGFDLDGGGVGSMRVLACRISGSNALFQLRNDSTSDQSITMKVNVLYASNS